MIKTKRHPIKFQLFVWVSTLFLIPFIVITTWFLIDTWSEITAWKSFFYLFAFTSSYTICIAYLITYVKNTPTVTLNDKQLTINKKNYPLNSIKKVKLKERLPFKYLNLSYDKNAMLIILKNGNKEILYDSMYSNLWQIKCKLDEYINKAEPIPETFLEKQANANIEDKQVFKRHPLLFFYGIFTWAVTVMIIYSLLFLKPNMLTSIILLGFGVLYFFLNSLAFYYVKLSANYLIIKNQGFFWINNIYKLKDIVSVVIEEKYFFPYGGSSHGYPVTKIQVITSDYKCTAYYAHPLSKKHWKELIAQLQAKEIDVTDLR